MTEPDFRPPSQQQSQVKTAAPSNTGWKVGVGVLALALAGMGWYVWQGAVPTAPVHIPSMQPQSAVAGAPVENPAEAVQAETPRSAETTAEPAHPLAPLEAEPVQDATALEQLVAEWLGRAKTLQFVALEGLAHHVVATVDNLPRGHAAPRLWPLHPVGGRMETVTASDQQLYIAPQNTARYDAVVGFVAALEMQQAVQIYRQAYPALQQAYEALGYPGKYFNDRLVVVIDHLLQTPEVQEPLALKLVQVQGSVPVAQPWLRYEFAQTQWQNLSAGQKILLRMGPVHAATVKAQLKALRSQIAKPAPL